MEAPRENATGLSTTPPTRLLPRTAAPAHRGSPFSRAPAHTAYPTAPGPCSHAPTPSPAHTGSQLTLACPPTARRGAGAPAPHQTRRHSRRQQVTPCPRDSPPTTERRGLTLISGLAGGPCAAAFSGGIWALRGLSSCRGPIPQCQDHPQFPDGMAPDVPPSLVVLEAEPPPRDPLAPSGAGPVFGSGRSDPPSGARDRRGRG